MAAYNAEQTVESAICSVLQQTVESLEVVVVDDGSVDGTAERVRGLAREDRRVRLYQQENRGQGAARNRATAEAQAELVTVLDADDLLLPEYLERMGAALAASPRAGMAYTDAWVLDDASGRIARKSAMAAHRPATVPPYDPRPFLQLLLRQGNFIFVATTSRRSVLEAVGPWQESLNGAEDYELWLRILAAGHPVVQVDGPLVVYRRRAGSHSSDYLRSLRAENVVYRLIAEEWDVDDETRAIARGSYETVERLIRRYDRERHPPLRWVTDRLRAIRGTSFAVRAPGWTALLRMWQPCWRRREALVVPDTRQQFDHRLVLDGCGDDGVPIMAVPCPTLAPR